MAFWGWHSQQYDGGLAWIGNWYTTADPLETLKIIGKNLTKPKKGGSLRVPKKIERGD